METYATEQDKLCITAGGRADNQNSKSMSILLVVPLCILMYNLAACAVGEDATEQFVPHGTM